MITKTIEYSYNSSLSSIFNFLANLNATLFDNFYIDQVDDNKVIFKKTSNLVTCQAYIFFKDIVFIINKKINNIRKENPNEVTIYALIKELPQVMITVPNPVLYKNHNTEKFQVIFDNLQILTKFFQTYFIGNINIGEMENQTYLNDLTRYLRFIKYTLTKMLELIARLNSDTDPQNIIDKNEFDSFVEKVDSLSNIAHPDFTIYFLNLFRAIAKPMGNGFVFMYDFFNSNYFVSSVLLFDLLKRIKLSKQEYQKCIKILDKLISGEFLKGANAYAHP